MTGWKEKVKLLRQKNRRVVNEYKSFGSRKITSGNQDELKQIQGGSPVTTLINNGIKSARLEDISSENEFGMEGMDDEITDFSYNQGII